MILRTKRTADIEKAVRAAIPQKAADRFPEISCSGFGHRTDSCASVHGS